MALDHELPVWTLRPNWSDPIIERLAWLTDVLASESGAEQRRALRLSPRRSFEAKFNPTNAERTFLDILLHRIGRNEFMVPLWHDRATLDASAVAGAVRLNFDTQYREFVAGGMALLIGPDAFTCEAVRISAVDAAGVDLAAPSAAAWAKGSMLHPMRRAYIDEDVNLSALTGAAGDIDLRFNINRANDYDPGVDSGLTYGGIAVLTALPNRVSALDHKFAYLAFDADGETGLRSIVDQGGRAFVSQQYEWQMRGRESQHAFRQMLYRLNGRLNPVWLPTFNDDIRVSRPAALAATALDIDKIGLGYVGGPAAGRDRVILTVDGGFEIAQISAMGAAPSPTEEQLMLSVALSQAIPADTFGSFIAISRLDQDDVEITHYADSDGAAEASLVFRSFNDARNPAGANHQPIVTATMAPESCGSPEPDNTCLPVQFEGWYYKVKGIAGPPGTGDLPTWSFTVPDAAGLTGTPFDTPDHSKFIASADQGDPAYPTRGYTVDSFAGGFEITFYWDVTPGITTTGGIVQFPYAAWPTSDLVPWHWEHRRWDKPTTIVEPGGLIGRLWPYDKDFIIHSPSEF